VVYIARIIRPSSNDLVAKVGLAVGGGVGAGIGRGPRPTGVARAAGNFHTLEVSVRWRGGIFLKEYVEWLTGDAPMGGMMYRWRAGPIRAGLCRWPLKWP